MFISAEKAGKEIRKIHGILYVYQCKKSRQRNNKKSWNFFFFSAGKQAKKQGQFLVYFYQCKKSRQRNKENG